MKKIAVITGTYNHFPDGLPDSEREIIYQRAYKPYLSTLYRYSDIQATLFYSGPLLNWLSEKHPEFIMLLVEMITRKQVEILGGGYHAPLLPIIPQPDRVGQCEALTTLIRKVLGKRPRGAWLKEYAWEQSLTGTIQASGFSYLFLSDIQFASAGVSSENRSKPVITEDQGKSVFVLPSHESILSKFEPFDSEMLKNLSSRTESDSIVTLMFKGEIRDFIGNFDSQIESFFEGLRNVSLDIETITPARALRGMRGLPVVYFPDSSSLIYKKNGFLKNESAQELKNITPISIRTILGKKTESMQLYHKMQYVHLIVSQIRGDKARKKLARDELWKSQTGNYYFDTIENHGFDFSYRLEAYKNLLEAEKIARDRGSFLPSLILADFNFDGENEYLIKTHDFNAYISLRDASVFEFDDFFRFRNYIDIERESNDFPTNSFSDVLIQNLPVDFGCIENETPKYIHESSYSEVEFIRNHPAVTFKKESYPVFPSKEGMKLGFTKILQGKKNELSSSWHISTLNDVSCPFFFMTTLALRFKSDSVLRFLDGNGNEISSDHGKVAYFDFAESIIVEEDKKNILKIVAKNSTRILLEQVNIPGSSEECTRLGIVFPCDLTTSSPEPTVTLTLVR